MAADSNGKLAFWVGGGVPNARQRVIDDEHVGDVLRAFGAEIVPRETANERQMGVSMATDSCQIGRVVAGGRVVAYLSVWRALFCLRPSDRCLAPSAPRLL